MNPDPDPESFTAGPFKLVQSSLNLNGTCNA
jgi:hypothetical protein